MNCIGLFGIRLERLFQAGRVNIVGRAFELDDLFGDVVQPSPVPGNVPHQRHRLGSQPRSLDRHADDLLHLRLEPVKLVKVDRHRRRVHFIDRVVHRRDQRCDRAAVERGEKGATDVGQHLADDVVGLVLAPLDFGDLLFPRTAVHQLVHRLGGRDERRRMRLEHAEEVALPWKHALKPSEHVSPLRLATAA